MRLSLNAKLAAVVSFLFLAAPDVHAQSIISSNYPPGGFTGSRANIQAPAGTTIIENGTLSYSTKRFVSGSGVGSTTGTVDVLVNRTLVGRVMDFQILGGDYFPAIVLPFANAALRPEPNSQKDFQLGDIVLQPLGLGWHMGNWHSSMSWNVFVPTGRFNAGASNNVGKGLTSHMLTGGVTWLQSSSMPWAANATLRYEYFGKQRDTGIQPGQVLTAEVGVGKQLSPQWELGLVGYFSSQITAEKGSAPGTDTTKYRVYGLGPEISWHPKGLPGSVISVRYYKEFGARNTSEGDLAVLSLGYAF